MSAIEQGIETVRKVQTRSTDLIEGVASVLPGPAGGLVRKGLALPLGLLALAVDKLPQPTGEQAPAYPTEKPAAKPTENTGTTQESVVEVAVDEFGAVGSLTDNTGVEPDGQKPPFVGYDKLSGDRVMAHVGESTDLPDLQVLLAYEEAHKNRKGVVQAVEARLAELGSPVS
jgi:hypothetical protein